MFHCFFALWKSLRICLSFCFLLFSLCGLLEWQNSLDGNFFFLLNTIYYYFTLLIVFHISISRCLFFTGVWVTACLRDSSQYAVVWMVSMLSYSQVLQSLFQSFGDCTKSSNYNWYHCHFHVLHFFSSICKVQVFIFLFTFFQFYCGLLGQQSPRFGNFSFFFFFFFFLLTITRSGHLAKIRWSVCISKSQKVVHLNLQDRFWVVHKPFVQISVSCTISGGLPSPPRCVQSYTLSGLICCICLCDSFISITT